MVDLMYCLKYLLFFDILLLYYYINLRSLIIFWLSSGYINLSWSISLSLSFAIPSELFYGEILKTFVVLLAILLPIKSPAVLAVLWIVFVEEVLSASVADCLAWSRSFWL